MNPVDLLEHALSRTTCDDATVIVTDSTSANLRWANNTVTTNGVMHSVSMTVISHLGSRAASVSGNVTTLDQARTLVEAADAAARIAEPAEDAAELVAGAQSADFDTPATGTDITVYADVAPKLGEAFARAGSAGRVLYGFVDHDVETTWLGNTRGTRLRHAQPTGHFACTAKTRDLSRSAWVGAATDDFTDIDPLRFDAELERRLSWAERTVDLAAGRYDTIMPGTSVADLMIYAYWLASARDAMDGQSLYSSRTHGTRIGERVAPESVTLFSDPTAKGLGCAPFVIAPVSSSESSVFDNGLPIGCTDWIKSGTLTSLIQTRHTAAESSQPFTPATDNLVLDASGAGTIDDLVAGMDDGLLLTCLWYIRVVDPQTMLLTGLTRDGVYQVRGGEIVGAVNNFRWNESPIDLLNRFSAASSTQRSFSREWGDDYFNRSAMPALRVPDFNMSSVSQAQ
ncbi:metallopeptidase TldD-related protein [soil metagenome]